MNTFSVEALRRYLSKTVGTKTWGSIENLMHDESGQDLIEYALVAALIALGALVSMRGLANRVSNAFNLVGNNLTSGI